MEWAAGREGACRFHAIPHAAIPHAWVILARSRAIALRPISGHGGCITPRDAQT